MAVERWDEESRAYQAVASLSREVDAGEEYFLRYALDKEGYYRATATLGEDRKVLRFRHRVQTLPEVGDTFYSADAGGGALFIAPSTGESTMVDVRFLLLEDGRVVDSGSVEDRVLATSTKVEADWSTVLERGGKYGSVAVVMNEGKIRLLPTSFEAGLDAAISGLSADENRVEVEVTGGSQVPLDASLHLALTRNSSTARRFEEDVAPLLGGDEESFDLFWDRVLEPGEYTVEAVLESGDGALDRRSVVVDAGQDAEITDVYGDSNGATVTVEGASEIPLRGRVHITVERDGEVVQDREVDAPVVLEGNEETVEVEWGRDLEPGDYVVRAELRIERGTIDRAGNVFTVERPLPGPTPTPAQNSPGPGVAAAALCLAAAACVSRK